ncbi:MAG TPA: tRNA (guanosine(46)-N7)-methyltransferase TrmB [Lacibacter sp.]|nr:tRNA (guanosine(46)-N7)-methyltransferase TrmB [Lacibacter sp.]HMO88397.1 tRNA (guanosine(46)-N7)-methyltransferase TrmB [Lacibacter sp.]HMP87169.1 tRNA (guanosine(46)-N7)-methyltransferase TrmB [Lacibacter sp.]
MGQKKLIRFAELETFPNVLQYPNGMQGQWPAFFNNDHPLTLELACGKGEYAVGLGRMYPQRNFLGVDQKGNRIWVGARTALRDGLHNVAFLRTQMDRIDQYFAPGEVAEIWLTFPDPQLRCSKHKKRLTHPKYLRLYRSFLQPGARIHLKTDSPVLYRFTREVIRMFDLPLHTDFDDVYAVSNPAPELCIKTHYEALDIAGSNRVHYLCFGLSDRLSDLEKDRLLKEWVFENESDSPEKQPTV